MKTRRIKPAGYLIVSAISVLTTSGHAVEAPAGSTVSVIEEIVVLGSRIRRQDFIAPSPISTLDRQTLDYAVQPTLEETLNKMPQVLPDFDRTANNPGDGTARVNLRGLGSQRTLVLLNGRRMAPSGVGGSVDVNNIPQALIERVELITGGATTVYGSDAVAGVVNFITREDFEGFGVETSYYTTEEGDSDTLDINISYGGTFAENRGNLMLYGGYYDRDATYAADRELTSVVLSDIDGVIEESGNNRVPAGSILFPLADLGEGPVRISFDPDGNPIRYREPEDRYNTAATSYLQTPLTRYTAGVFLNFDLTENHETYLELSYSNTDSKQNLSPVGVGGFFDTNFDNPVLTPEAQQIFADSYLPVGGNVVSYFLGRRLNEVGTRTLENSGDYARIVAGFRGNLAPGWDYDVWATHTSSEFKTRLLNDASYTRFQQGLLVDPVTGQCFDPANGCVPVDVFGAGRISPEAVAFIGLPPLKNKSTRDSTLVSGFVRGSPFDSWAGPVETVVGLEWRDDSGDFSADDALFTGDSLGYTGNAAVDGSESVIELYGEVLVPLIQDARYTRYLAVEGGARYSDYDNAGTNDTWKLGAEWLPVDGLMFRTMFQNSVRAPSLSESFQEQFISVTPFVTNTSDQDPCSASADPVGNGFVNNCISTGLPADQIGLFEANVAYPTQVIQGGNPELEAEHAESFTLGVVLSPERFNSWVVSVDYFDITVKDTIGLLEPTLACFDPANTSAKFCSAIRRNQTSFDVAEVQATSYNRGELRVEGIDTQISYQTQLPTYLTIGSGNADFNANLIWTHVFENSIRETPQGTKLKCNGYFGFPCVGLSDSYTNPEDRIFATASYRAGDLSLYLAWRWISGTDNAALLVPDFLGGPVPDLAIGDIGSKSYFDLGVGYSFTSNLLARFSVSNLLDTDAPLMADAVNTNNTDTRMYDVFGRAYSLSFALQY